MKNSRSRFFRLLFALAICGAITSQLPLGKGTVLASDGYPDPSSKLLGANTGTALGLTGLAQAGAHLLSGGKSSLFGLQNLPIYDVYRNHGDQFSHVVRLIHNAELTNFYRESSSHTLLLPTDTVLLAALGKERLEALEKPANRDKAAAFLRARTLEGSYNISRLTELARAKGTVTTLDGKNLTLRREGDRLFIEKVEVLALEFPASNGFILVTAPLLTFDDED